MIYATYDEQSSHPGYVDMVFKELKFKQERFYSGMLVCSLNDLYQLIIDGYVPDFCELPEWFDDRKSISNRRIKKLCKKIFIQYG